MPKYFIRVEGPIGQPVSVGPLPVSKYLITAKTSNQALSRIAGEHMCETVGGLLEFYAVEIDRVDRKIKRRR